MSSAKVRNDATASTRGTIFHLCVAVKKCYELRDGEKLLIEELGDVTIEGKQQIEVKQYSDHLTDGHNNLWNTLKNWMADDFDHTQYKSLVLHTTQEFGPTSTISVWNDSTLSDRMVILTEIHNALYGKYQTNKKIDSNLKPSKVLNHQRFVLDMQRRSKLEDVISKVWIEANTKVLPDLYDEIKQSEIRGVHPDNKSNYLDSLIGYVCRSDKQNSDRWIITYEEFSKQLENLYATFGTKTIEFPRKHFVNYNSEKDVSGYVDIFVKKIRDIEYHEVICKAIHDYEATLATIDEEFGMYSVALPKVVQYANEVLDRYETAYRRACRNCSNELRDSKNLYDDTVGVDAAAMPGFFETPDGFRNGLIHQRMDNPDVDYMWRVRKYE